MAKTPSFVPVDVRKARATARTTAPGGGFKFGPAGPAAGAKKADAAKPVKPAPATMAKQNAAVIADKRSQTKRLAKY